VNDKDQVLISPRYVAGTGPVQDAIGPLIHLFEWPWINDDATCRITVTSPVQTTIVDFDLSERFGRWWTVTQDGVQDWQAALTRQAPAETIDAVTRSLPQLPSDQRHIAPLDTALDPMTVVGYSYSAIPTLAVPFRAHHSGMRTAGQRPARPHPRPVRPRPSPSTRPATRPRGPGDRFDAPTPPLTLTPPTPAHGSAGLRPAR
jgi:hypothetical protein